MIEALASFGAAASRRTGGLAAEAGSTPEEQSFGASRDARAQSNAQVLSIRSGAVPVLSKDAVLAIAATEETTHSNGRSKPEGATPAGEGAKTQSGQSGTNNGLGSALAEADDAAGGAQSKEGDADGDGLNEAEEKQVEELKQRDREVRAHEQAHARVGGAYASAPTYTFQQGPDGKRYAVGGEVQIDTSKENSPEKTIQKMQIVIRAALAPAEPSSQDLKVAQQARASLSEAQAERRQQKAEEQQGSSEEDGGIVNAANRIFEAGLAGGADAGERTTSALDRASESGSKNNSDNSAENGEASDFASDRSSGSTGETSADERVKAASADAQLVAAQAYEAISQLFGAA